MTEDQEVKEIMRLSNVDEVTARFMWSIEKGIIPGDVMTEGDDDKLAQYEFEKGLNNLDKAKGLKKN